MYFSVSLIEGGKEAEPLNMVRVKVREQYVDSSVLSQCSSQSPDACAGVENDYRVLVTADLDAGRVAAVAHSLRARTGKRPPSTPKRDLRSC